MPTLGGHFSEDEADLVKRAASKSREGKPGPYIVAAVRERMKNEGFKLGEDDADFEVVIQKAVAAVGRDAFLALAKKISEEALAAKAASHA